MFRMKPIANAGRAERYYGKSDGGYYLGGDELRNEWGGLGADKLGLSGTPDFEQFKRLIHGLDPHTGQQLTAKLIDDRIPAWDATASVPKGVTTALECGDSRIRDLIWQANREAMNDLQEYATTRVRKGGQQEDRLTGNLVWYTTEHAETRPVDDPSFPADHQWRVMPDWDRHLHNVVFNLTFDPVEQEWKAVKFRPIMEERRFFDRRFDARLAHLLAEAGYEIETKWKADDKGRPKYFTWDIKGMPEPVTKRFSRRTGEVDDTEQEILDAVKERAGAAPEKLSAVARDQLGATSRLVKRDDLTLADFRAFWQSRITPEELKAIAQTIADAVRGRNAQPEKLAAKAVSYAIAHHGEREAVMPYTQLAITAMERSLGSASPAEIDREIQRQGIVRVIGGERLVTTKELLADERRMVAFASNGRGTCRALNAGGQLERDWLDGGQAEAVSHVWNSHDRVMMIRGAAGTGKTTLMQEAVAGIERAGKKVVVLAPGTEASRGVLRAEGFADADTVAAFLVNEKRQEQARGGVIWIDEAGQLSTRDMGRVFELAGQLGARVILSGDKRQHGSVAAGAVLRVLEDEAGIKPAEVVEIKRQKDGGYKQAVTLLSEGKSVEGFDALDRLGFIREVQEEDRYRQMAADYLQALDDKASCLVVSPTHREGERCTEEIRGQMRLGNRLGADERDFLQLKPANLTEAERGDAASYAADDVIVFTQNAKGGHKRGERLAVTDANALPLDQAGRFQVYRAGSLPLAAGDSIRITANGETRDGHRLNNGAIYQVAGFSKEGHVKLSNGWLVDKDFGHLAHGYVVTSPSSQGKTVDRVIIGQAARSFAASSKEQLYVSASRARASAMLYTDDKAGLREVIERSSAKRAALDLVKGDTPKRQAHGQLHRFRRWAGMARLRAAQATQRLWQHAQERQVSR